MAKIQKSFRLEERDINLINSVPHIFGVTETEKIEKILSTFGLGVNNQELKLFTRELVTTLSIGLAKYTYDAENVEDARKANEEIRYSTPSSFLGVLYNIGCHTELPGIIAPVYQTSTQDMLSQMNDSLALRAIMILSQEKGEALIKEETGLEGVDYSVKFLVRNFSDNYADLILPGNLCMSDLRNLGITTDDLARRYQGEEVDDSISGDRNSNFTIHLSSSVAEKLYDSHGLFSKSRNETVRIDRDNAKGLFDIILTGKKGEYRAKYEPNAKRAFELWREYDFSSELFTKESLEKREKHNVLIAEKEEEERAKSIRIANLKAQELAEKASMIEWAKEDGSEKLKLLVECDIDCDILMTTEYISSLLERDIPIAWSEDFFIDVEDDVEFEEVENTVDISLKALHLYKEIEKLTEGNDFFSIVEFVKLDSSISQTDGMADGNGSLVSYSGEIAIRMKYDDIDIFICNV